MKRTFNRCITSVAATLRRVRNKFALGLHNGIELWGERTDERPRRITDLSYRVGHAIGRMLTEPALAGGGLRPSSAPPLTIKRTLNGGL